MRGGTAVVAVGLVVVLLWVVVVAPRLDAPEPQVARYLAATSSGNEQEALEAWPTFAGGIHPKPTLMERRESVTRDLAAVRVGRSYRVTSIEWWRTCCEPGRIDGPGNAGLARMHVTATDSAGNEHRLVFQVFAKNLAYWGDAGGERFRDWKLYEVYREDQTCVFPSSAYGCFG